MRVANRWRALFGRETPRCPRLPRNMPIGPKNMPLMQHFNELRRRLVVVLVCLLVATIVLYTFSPQLIAFLMEPIGEFLPGVGKAQINILDPLGGFMLRFKVSFVAAIIVTAPVWIWNLFAFFLPALRPNERKWVVPTFFAGLVLFALGTVFCYFIILDAAFDWLLAQTADFATILPDAYSYINVILAFELSFGIAFELPLVVFYLIVFNLVPYAKFRKSWRVIYIVLMVLCAFVTPDASPVTMLLLFAAMVGLYELSLALARVALRKRIARQAAREAAEAEGIDFDEQEAALQRAKQDEKAAKRKRLRTPKSSSK